MGYGRQRKSKQIRIDPLFEEYARRMYPKENNMYDVTHKLAKNLEEVLYGKKHKKE